MILPSPYPFSSLTKLKYTIYINQLNKRRRFYELKRDVWLKKSSHPPTHIVDVCSLPPSALDDHDRWLKSKI